MKISEIRKEVIAFILADINLSLLRLGVSENVEIVEIKDNTIVLVSKPIKQMPMMFREVTVEGSMFVVVDDSIKLKEGDVLINVHLGFKTLTFDYGHNGCDIGHIMYKILAMPEDIEADEVKYYIRRIQGLTI